MSPEQMRKALKDRYKSANWDKKVDAMSDKQIMAIYYRFLNN